MQGILTVEFERKGVQVQRGTKAVTKNYTMSLITGYERVLRSYDPYSVSKSKAY